MENSELQIYIHPDRKQDMYPQRLDGDMSVFEGFKYEVQWLFYLHLRDRFPVLQLSADYPEKGIFLIHKSNVWKFDWNPDLFVVSAQWDHPRDDRAQVHLVANNYKATDGALSFFERITGVGFQYCTCPIMHPVITPRSENRGDRLENVVFMGNPKNLDPAFRTDEFRKEVEALGMKFIIVDDPHKHSDFSEVDVAMAVREIGKVVNNKPAVKLYNSWRGKVPALLGCEIGFREVRENEYDYIEVDSVQEVLDALIKLRDNPEFRSKMIANAEERGKPYLMEAQQQRWVDVFDKTIIPYYEKWIKTPRFVRRCFLVKRWIHYQLRTKGAHFIHEVLGIRAANYH